MKVMESFLLVAFVCCATCLYSISAQAGGLAFDAVGNLYVTDWSRHSVFKYTPDGTKSTFATKLTYPGGLCFDGKGNLFVSDEAAIDTKRQPSILKFTPDGKRSTFVTGISSFGMAFDLSGNLFVSQGDSIFKFTPEGKKSTFVTSKRANFIDLAFDEAGNLFVVDQSLTAADTEVGRSIFKFSPDGTKTAFASGLKDPTGLAVDKAGDVYVGVVTAADASSHAILKFSADGTESTLNSALGIFVTGSMPVDRSGDLFVSNGHSILKINPSGTSSTFASDWLSTDKQWEYKCVAYDSECSPEIVKAGTTQMVLDLSDLPSGSKGRDAEIVWAPDSKRFAFNYGPPTAAHTTYETVAFYQLHGDKWVALHAPADDTSDSPQMVQLLKGHLPKGFNPRHCAPDRDILKVRDWADANNAILYAPCYGRTSGQLEAGFLFTLKFDAEGKWKIVKMHRLSKKELEQQE
jgi:sugar lactone lactonase YvrE